MRMPYDQRRSGLLQNTTTSNLCHRQRSRRRIAAVSFLSNISLDGTHQDTNLRQFTSLSNSLQQKDGSAQNKRLSSSYRKEGMLSSSCRDSKLSVVEGSVNSLVSDSVDQIKRSTSSFKNVPLETVGDANIHMAQPVPVHKLTSTLQEIKHQSQSNRSSINSDFDIESQGVNITLNKSNNPNLNSNLGSLDANPALNRSNSISKRSHVSSTLEKCALASRQVATKVRSLTARSNMTRTSMSNSNTSVSTCTAVPEDQLITGQGAVVGKQLTRNSNDKENIGPEFSNDQKTRLQENQGVPVANSAVESESIIKERLPARRRKLSSNPLATSGGSDKGFSSCESIGAQLVPSGVARTRKPSSSISESSSSNAPTNIKEIKYLRLGHLPSSTTTGADYRSCTVAEYRSGGVPPSSEPRGAEGRSSSGPSVGGQGSTVCVASVTACVARHAAEGRVLLTTGKGPPLHVFSLIKYKFHGGGVPGTEGGGSVGASVGPRKRNVSGSRHLATIADTADTAPLLPAAVAQNSPPVVMATGGGGPVAGSGGLAGKLQEVSYCNLLVSSQYFGGGKKRHLSDQTSTDDRVPVAAAATTTQQQQQQHALLARCFSHDPGAAVAAAVAGGHATSMDPSHALPPPVTSYSQSAIASLTAVDIVPAAGGGGTSLATAKPTPHWAARAASNYNYAPELLDDPELRAGKHRKLLRFPSYMISLIDYAKPDELKREVNDKFRTKFPHVKITLSKLRSLKREMVHIVQQSFSSGVAESCALLTVAHAHAYFDSLCLSGAVEKTSRKPLAGACIMISAKINDVKGEVLATLIDRIECQLRVDRCDLLSSEFVALLSLQFSIHLPTQHINTHYQRLMFEH